MRNIYNFFFKNQSSLPRLQAEFQKDLIKQSKKDPNAFGDIQIGTDGIHPLARIFNKSIETGQVSWGGKMHI